MVHKKCHKLYRDTCSGTFEGGSTGQVSGAGSVHSSENSPNSGHLHHLRQDVNGAGGGTSDITILSKDDIKLSNVRQGTPGTGRRPHAAPHIPGFDGAGAGGGQNVDVLTEESEVGSQGQYSIKDFELLRVIGRGSYAKVLMVELKKNRRIYAMKVIKKELVTDDEDIDWVQTEKHVFETASNYPFLVGLHSCFQTQSR